MIDPCWSHFHIWTKLSELLDGWLFDPWQDKFKHFIISICKRYFGKPNTQLRNSYPSTNSWVRIFLYRFTNFTYSLIPGLLCRMQLSNAYTLPWVYSAWAWTVWRAQEQSIKKSPDYAEDGSGLCGRSKSNHWFEPKLPRGCQRTNQHKPRLFGRFNSTYSRR